VCFTHLFLYQYNLLEILTCIADWNHLLTVCWILFKDYIPDYSHKHKFSRIYSYMVLYKIHISYAKLHCWLKCKAHMILLILKIRKVDRLYLLIQSLKLIKSNSDCLLGILWWNLPGLMDSYWYLTITYIEMQCRIKDLTWLWLVTFKLLAGMDAVWQRF